MEEMIMLTTEQKNRVEKIISDMTLEEKIGQLNLESPSIVGGFDVPFEELIEMVTDGRLAKAELDRIMASAEQDYHEDGIRAGKVGSLMLSDPEKINELQKIAVEESRLGIPLLFGLDVIHGFRTVFPIAIAEAGTFDESLMEQTARMAARESHANGVNWHFAPMVDIARDARWGRVSEGPGEDPYLGSIFARAKIRGLQKPAHSEDPYVAACLKHYVGYGACESGRDYNTVNMAMHQFYNNYLRPFEAAVQEGAHTAMAAFNDFNGIPCTVNKFLLRDILKDSLGMAGFVVSDANAIKECVNHGIAADDADAGAQAVNAGLDMDMGTGIYTATLQQAVESGKVTVEVIDEAVRRILSVKMWLGLFEHPYIQEAEMHRYDVLPEDHLALALRAAEKSIVLLKNSDDLLPLDPGKRVALVGTLADKPEEVVGAWALNWKMEDCVSIRTGMEQAFSNMEYFPCGGPEGELNQDEVKAAGEYGDVIVAVLGETTAMSGEAASRSDITLPGQQQKLLAQLLETGKPVVLVLMNGRPLALQWENEHIPAIVEAWHLGIQMGHAVANILSGKAAPEGKLSSSFPAVTGQCPVYYNHPSTGRPASGSKFTSKYLDAPLDSLYPFGHGLSYTRFSLSDLQVEENQGTLTISAAVENVGSRTGTETVQLYVQDVSATLVRPVKELKDFEKVRLASGEKTEIRFELSKKDMGFFDNQRNYRLEDGLFRIFVGSNSRECISHEINVKF